MKVTGIYYWNFTKVSCNFLFLPAYTIEAMTFLSFGGAHFAIITCIAGNDTPCNSSAQSYNLIGIFVDMAKCY